MSADQPSAVLPTAAPHAPPDPASAEPPDRASADVDRPRSLLRRLRPSPHHYAPLVGLFCLVVLGLWWAGFYPGISTVDSMQQWDQGKAWIFQDWHPVFHTWVIAVLQRIWFTPAAVTLLQVVTLATVLGSLTRRLQRAGLRTWIAVAIPCLIALSPQTGFTSIVMWKDIPFAISVLWVFTEVLDLATDPDRYLGSRWHCTRLGLSLLAVLLFRQNGILVAGIIVAGIVVAHRRRWAELALPIVIAIGGNVAVKGPLYTYLDAQPTPVLFSYTTFMHDMAAFVNDHGDDMNAADKAFLEQILPFDRWKAPSAANPDGLYFCRQATPLIFAKEFYPANRMDGDGNVVPSASLPKVLVQNSDSVFLATHRSEFRSMWMRFVRKWPGTFLGQRFCVGSLAWSPWHKTGLEVFEPPQKATVPTPELQVRPLSNGLKSFLSDDVLRRWDRNGLRFITWRAVTWVYVGFIACLVAARRRRNGRFLIVVLPGFAAWFSVLTFTPGQSARYMFPAYLCALSSLALFGRPRVE